MKSATGSAMARAGRLPAAVGMWLGVLGVVSFSLTLPATRVAVAAFDPLELSLARALLAAVLAAVSVIATRQPWPSRRQWGHLAVVALGVVLGFPILSAFAMQEVPANHGAVVVGLLPLVTAVVATIHARERQSLRFWLAAGAGSVIVIAYSALHSGWGHLEVADLLLLGAVIAAAFGYSEGAQLTKQLGSWQVISWALILAAPFLIVPFVWQVSLHGFSGPGDAWVGFLYVAIISQFVGFIVWYRGLAIGGTARVSQIQLLQPFMTIVAAGLLLGERITALSMGAAILVMATVFIGQRSGRASRGPRVAGEAPHATSTESGAESQAKSVVSGEGPEPGASSARSEDA